MNAKATTTTSAATPAKLKALDSTGRILPVRSGPRRSRGRQAAPLRLLELPGCAGVLWIALSGQIGCDRMPGRSKIEVSFASTFGAPAFRLQRFGRWCATPLPLLATNASGACVDEPVSGSVRPTGSAGRCLSPGPPRAASNAMMVLICYDGSAGAQAAISRAGKLMPGIDATVLVIWEPTSLDVTRMSTGAWEWSSATA
jgi:hypothetical protein